MARHIDGSDLLKDPNIAARVADVVKPPSLSALFKKLRDARSDASASGNTYVAAELDKHLSYFARKVDRDLDALVAGRTFRLRSVALFTDMLTNVTSVMAMRQPEATPSAAAPAAAADAPISKVIALAERRLEGWCSREKAEALAEIVLRDKPEVCVEIGVYGGRSLVPVAAALRQIGKGAIYGIETWRADVAIQHVTNAENDGWWAALDFNRIKSTFLQFIAEQGLAMQVRIIEAPAADAAAMFGSIDYLHIDGAHSIFNAAEDTVLYGKKVRKGGTIVLDDANWPTTAPAQAILRSFSEEVRSLRNEAGEVDCIIFRKL